VACSATPRYAALRRATPRYAAQQRAGVFHDLKNVKIADFFLKIGQLLPILANFSHIL
jgi:hypothetical protein